MGEANRANIIENGKKVADLLRAHCGPSCEEVSAIQGLSDEDKAAIAAALNAPAPAPKEEVTANKKAIAENEAELHSEYLEVMTNKEKLYDLRAFIEDNRAKILANYAEAFVGNRQVANQNTDDIFKNRSALLDSMTIEGQSKENYRNSKYNEANVDYLENRSLLNNRVAKVNKKMSEINADLININKKIMETNEETVKFNASAIETNVKLLDGIQLDKATPEANAARIKDNKDKIAMIKSKVGKYDTTVEEQVSLALANKEKIEANREEIRERRKAIKENRKKIIANGEQIADRIRGA